MASAQARVAEKERLTYDSEHLALQRDLQAGSDRWKEAADAARQKADAERRAESAQAAQLGADQNLRLAELEVARLKVRHEACSIKLHSIKLCKLVHLAVSLHLSKIQIISHLLLNWTVPCQPFKG